MRADLEQTIDPSPSAPSTRAEITATGEPRLRRAWPVVAHLVSLLLVYAALMPTMSEIGGWDEASHVNAGRLLIEDGTLPGIADSPLSAVVYGLAYLVFQHSPLWLMYCVWVGRLVSYTLLFSGTYSVARGLVRYANPLIVIVVFALCRFVLEMLIYPSDPLFAGMGALSLGQLLRYLEKRNTAKLAWASAWMSMAVFARPDGLALSLIFLGLVLVAGSAFRKLGQSLLAGWVPLLVVVGGFVLLKGETFSSWAVRSYRNFESGHGAVYRGTGQIDAEIEVHLEAARVYGSAQENNHSILRAIMRRPDLYLQRLRVTLIGLPQVVLRAYGIRIGVPLFLLALRGAIELFRRRERLVLAVLCLWAAPVATGFVITLFRSGHLLFPFYVVLALAGIGVSALVSDLRNPRLWVVWSVVLAGFATYGVVDNKLGITYGSGVLLLGILIAGWVIRQPPRDSAAQAVPLLVLLCSGLIIRGNFPSPMIPSPGSDPIVETVLFLDQRYAREDRLAAGYPGIASAARMEYLPLVDEDVPLDLSPREFLAWMKDQGADAVFVDRTLFADNPALWAMIYPELDVGLETVFMTDDGDIRVAEIRIGP